MLCCDIIHVAFAEFFSILLTQYSTFHNKAQNLAMYFLLQNVIISVLIIYSSLIINLSFFGVCV